MAHDFHRKRRIVVQLLKDWADQFGSTTIKSDRNNGEGHWLLTGEILKHHTSRNDVFESKRQLAKVLKKMRAESHYFTHLKRTFLDADAAHSAYDELATRAAKDAAGVRDGIKRLIRNFGEAPHNDQSQLARTLVTYWENNASDAMKTEHAIDLLTHRCADLNLVCDFPALTVKEDTQAANRRKVDEAHAEIRQVFEGWCKTIREENPAAKRYRNKAIEATVVSCGVSKRTVQRAIGPERKAA